MELKHDLRKLNNGILVMKSFFDIHNVVSLNFWFKCGHLSKGPYGIAHLSEHCSTASPQFGKTKERGGMLNAYVSYDKTCFFSRVHKNDAETSIDELKSLTFDEYPINNSFFEGEKKIIKKEIDNSSKNLSKIALDEWLRRNFVDFDRALTPNWKEFEEITIGDYLKFRNLNYSPSNCVINLVGNIHEDLFDKYCDDFKDIQVKSNGSAYIPIKAKLEAANSNKWIYLNAGENTFAIAIGFRLPSLSMKNFILVRLINDLLVNIPESILANEIRGKRKLAYKISNATDLFSTFGYFFYFIRLSSYDDVMCCKNILEEIFDQCNEYRITIEKLELAKKRLRIYLELLTENTSKLALKSGDSLLSNGTPFCINQYKQELEKIDLSELMRFMNDFITLKDTNGIIITNQ